MEFDSWFMEHLQNLMGDLKKDKETSETRNVYRNNLDNFVSVFFLAYANMDFTKMVTVKICKTKL